MFYKRDPEYTPNVAMVAPPPVRNRSRWSDWAAHIEDELNAPADLLQDREAVYVRLESDEPQLCRPPVEKHEMVQKIGRFLRRKELLVTYDKISKYIGTYEDGKNFLPQFEVTGLYLIRGSHRRRTELSQHLSTSSDQLPKSETGNGKHRAERSAKDVLTNLAATALHKTVHSSDIYLKTRPVWQDRFKAPVTRSYVGRKRVERRARQENPFYTVGGHLYVLPPAAESNQLSLSAPEIAAAA